MMFANFVKKIQGVKQKKSMTAIDVSEVLIEEDNSQVSSYPPEHIEEKIWVERDRNPELIAAIDEFYKQETPE